jgi:hypothetical protein
MIAASRPDTKGKRFFFEKKKQKTFKCCRALVQQCAPKTQKFFGSFFQKRTSSLTASDLPA